MLQYSSHLPFLLKNPLEKYSIKKLLFTNDYLDFKDDTTKLIFDIVELYTVSNNSTFQLTTNIDAPFVLKFYGFKYGEQNGVIVTSSVGDKFFKSESVARLVSVNQINNSIAYFENLYVEEMKKPYLLSLNNDFKTVIEVTDQKPYKSHSPKREYKIWQYVIGSSTDDVIPFGEITYQYRYHEFDENDLNSLKEVMKEYFKL